MSLFAFVGWFAGPVALGMVAMSLGCSSADFSYRAPDGVDVEARFGDADAGLVILGVPKFMEPGGFLERRLSNGEVIYRTSLLPEYRPPRGHNFQTVDDGRLLLRLTRSAPSQFGLAPHSEAIAPLERAVRDWLERSGGLLLDDASSPTQSTNPNNDYSCAIGADRSVAIWDCRNPSSFRTAGPGAFVSGTIVEIACLEGGGVPTVAVHIVDGGRPRGSTSRLFMLGRSVQEVEGFSSTAEGPIYHQATAAALVSPLVDVLESVVGYSRIVNRDGAWIVETARIEGQWPERRFVAWRDETEAWVGDVERGEIRRVGWPSDANSIVFAGPIMALANTPYKRGALSVGLFEVSARGDHVLWNSPDSEGYVIERVQASGG